MKTLMYKFHSMMEFLSFVIWPKAAVKKMNSKKFITNVTYCQLIHGQAKRIDYTPVINQDNNNCRRLVFQASGFDFFHKYADVRLNLTVEILAESFRHFQHETHC
jgi:hypothetical protein